MGARVGCALALVATACSFEATHGTGYKCVDDGDCPEGQACVDLHCETPADRVDAATPPATVDAGLPNLVRNPGFESADLDAWNTYNSSIDRSGTEHSGSFAGTVCRGASLDDFTAYQFLSYAPVPTGSYHATAYVRAEAAGTSLPMRLTIRESAPAGYVNHDGDEVVVGNGWEELSVDGVVDATDLEWIQLIVWGLSGDDLCYLVDDIVVVLVP